MQKHNHLPRRQDEGDSSPSTNARPVQREGEADDPRIGRSVGGFRLVRLLGEGGMGSVFLAEQHEPIHRMVALKLMRESFDDPVGASRFMLERQTLARLSHPNVAAIYEAGATPEGFPFFVMELVEGEPLMTYCDERNLPVRERLALFIGICRGVQHAHLRGVVHRDLKPANVLVTEVEGTPVAKVIDFGIAKALDQPLSDAAHHTRRGSILGTPAYMSPEALAGDPLDTRADLYSLGVLLNELLTSTQPHQLGGMPLVSAIRRVGEVDAPSPATLFRRLEPEEQSRVAAMRGENAHSLSRLLAGDLGAIAQKATARRREERYQSAGELASDVERYLRDEPVIARTPSFFYVARKFARRHMVGVLAASAVVLAIVAGVITTTIAMVRAQRASAEAEAVSAFLLDLMGAASPWRSSRDTTVRELLDEAARRVPTDLQDQPRAQARLLAEIATSQYHLGQAPEAERLMRESLRLHIQIYGEQHSLVAGLKNDLAQIIAQRHAYTDAVRLLRESVATRIRIHGRMDHRVARGMMDLGVMIEAAGGSFEEANSLVRESLAIRQELYAQGNPEVELATLALTWGVLAEQLERNGQLMQAEQAARRALALREQTGERNYPWARNTLLLAHILAQLGRGAEAEVQAREGLAVLEQFVEPGDPRLGDAKVKLAESLRRQAKLSDAEAILESVRRDFDHPVVIATALHRLANIRTEQEKYEEAEHYFREALALFPPEPGLDRATERKVRADFAALRAKTRG